MASSRRHSSSSVALSIPAEGLRHGCPVTVCRNLYASFKGAPLTLMPSLQFPSSPTAAQPAADFFPGVYPALTFRAVDAGELFTTVGSFHSTSGDVAAVQPLSLEENARYSRALLAAYSSLVANCRRCRKHPASACPLQVTRQCGTHAVRVHTRFRRSPLRMAAHTGGAGLCHTRCRRQRFHRRRTSPRCPCLYRRG